MLALRAGKGMVLDPADPDTYSVGSFFTNPVLPAARLRRRCADAVPATQPPSWPAADGSVKVSAAWLIERAGFAKGYGGGHPGVAVSGKHTLALTNRGTGSPRRCWPWRGRSATACGSRSMSNFAPNPYWSPARSDRPARSS